MKIILIQFIDICYYELLQQFSRYLCDEWNSKTTLESIYFKQAKIKMTKINNLNSSAISGFGDRLWAALDLSLAQFGKVLFENIENWVEAKNNNNNYVANRIDNDSYYNGISVLYKLNDQYYHVVCSTYLEADHILQTILTDEKRTPVGIYNTATNHFDWEITGQYHFDVDPINKSVENADESIKTIANALRRRDASWTPGLFQRASLFA